MSIDKRVVNSLALFLLIYEVIVVAIRTQVDPMGIQVIVEIVLAVGIEAVVDTTQVVSNCQIVVVGSMAAGRRPY